MRERYTVSYTTGAKEDLRSIYSYVAFKLKERQVAKRLVERIRKEIRALNTFPERFQSVEWEPCFPRHISRPKVCISHFP